MRILVFGAGLQGSACAYDLLRREDVERVSLADRRDGELPPYLEPFLDDPRLERRTLDARDEAQVLAAMDGVNACLNALPYSFNLGIARLAVRAGVHYADLGGNTEIVFRQLELDEDARARGISVVPDSGLAPGMANILAAAGLAELDETESVRIYVGGLPRDPQPPLNYQLAYSLEGVIDYYTTPSWVLRDGRRQRVEALSEVEPVEFDEPLGTLEAFHTGGGLSVLPWTYEGRVRTMEYKTLRFPGHADIVRAIRDLGLFTLEPLRVDSTEVVPRRVFIACAEPRLRRSRGPDLVALRVQARGRRHAEDRTITFELVDFQDQATGITAMERATGFSLAITGVLQVRGRIPHGVATPDRCVPADEYIAELAARGLHVRRDDGP